MLQIHKIVLMKRNSCWGKSRYSSISLVACRYYMIMYCHIQHDNCRNKTWTRLCMMTSSNGNIFRVTGPLCGEFTGTGEFPTQRPVTRSFDVLFHLCLNKRLGKQPWGWWLETPSWSLWRQCNAEVKVPYVVCIYMWDFTICPHWRRGRLLWPQLPVPPVATELASWWPPQW